MYFPNGALKQFTYGNGIVHTMAQNARQLPASSIDTGGALSQQFGYDENGNVTAVTDALDPARSKAMVYDGLDRLTSASATVFGGTGVHQFAYDPLDNLRSWTLGGVKDQSNYVYGTDNRLSQIKDTGGNVVHAFSYDPQGNVTTRNGIAHDFDYGNRLRSVNATESYLYDGHGRRVQTTQSGGSVTRWMYASSGQMLFSAKGPSNPTTHENVYLAGSLVAIIDRDGPSNAITATTYQHTDALGSPAAMSNEAGAIIERTNYDPYGGPIGKTVNGLGYTGHVMDAATGLTYMQQRYYDQGVGRFLSVDPVTASSVNGGNFNRYKYAANNPYRFLDPDGRQEKTCTGSRIGCPSATQGAPQNTAEARADQRQERAQLTQSETRAAPPPESTTSAAPKGEADQLPTHINGVRAIYSCRETGTCVADPDEVERGGEYMAGFLVVTAGGPVLVVTVKEWGPYAAAALNTPKGRAVALACLRALSTCFGDRNENRFNNQQIRQQTTMAREAREAGLREAQQVPRHIEPVP